MAQINYNKITIYGGENLFDYVWIKNGIVPQSEINTINNFYYIPTFDKDTILLNNFNGNSLSAGTILSLTENIISWVVYKKNPNSSTLKFVAKIPVNASSIKDYNIVANQSYQYIIFAETENYLSGQLVNPEYIDVDWDYWSLTNLTKNGNEDIYTVKDKDVWIFNTNLSSDDIQQNLDKYTFKNFTQFPKVSAGETNYASGSLTAFLSNVNKETNQYKDTPAMMDDFNKMIANGNPKLLKDRKGNAWIVDTQSSGFSYIDNSPEQIVRVSFSFIQIEDANNVSVAK